MSILDILIFVLTVLVLGGLFYYSYSRKVAATINTSYLEALWEVEKLILSTLNFEEVAEKVTNVILTELGYMKLGYQIVVLALLDEKRQKLKRVAISHTESAQRFIDSTPVPFQQIEISTDEASNIAIAALIENKTKFTNKVADVLYPVIDERFVEGLQNELGIKTSMVVPIVLGREAIGVLIFSATKDAAKISEREKLIIRSFTQAVGISIQNARLFTSLASTTDQLRKANIKLQELDKLKDDFVSVASHELRTPMTAIRSYTWMALNRSDVPLSDKLKRYLSRTLISTERLINLVNDMLNVSRIEAGRIEIRPKGFDMIALANDVLAEVSAKAAEKALKVQVVPSQIPQVFADPDKVHQVLLNLVGNAMKFTPNEGSITISFFTDGKVVETGVKDTGTGISPEDQARLFKKFGRLDNSYVAAATTGGTGLGLFISKSLIDLMHGKIWATSEGMGKGATFAFSLPIATPELLAEAEKYVQKASGGEAKGLEPVAI